jgi:hypothetical protein
MDLNIKNYQINILLGALLAFLLSLLCIVAAFLPPFHLYFLNYSFISLMAGLLLLSLRIYNLGKDKNPLVKSRIVKRYIFPLLIIIDCALFYAYFIADKIKLFDNIENIKDYYGLYFLIVSFWIVLIFKLKK